MFSVLPFGNRTVILTLTGAQLEQASLTVSPRYAIRRIATGRFPQISGLKVTYHLQRHDPCRHRHVEDAAGYWRPGDPHWPGRHGTLVTNDFMYGGGDGYTAFTQGTNVIQPGDDLLQVAIDYVTANSPVAPVVEGRIVGP